MSLQDNVMSAMKAAMKEKNQTALAALRAVKSEILLVTFYIIFVVLGLADSSILKTVTLCVD